MRTFTEEEQALIRNMYENGETVETIRRRLRCSKGTLSEFLHDNGYKKRKKNTLKDCTFLSNSRKYTVDETYFDCIDTPNKAYWLGFLYADGNVHYGKNNGTRKGATVEVTLKEEDGYHLESFLYDLKADYPIDHRVITLNGKEYKAVRVAIHSVKMAAALEKAGCLPCKSLILKPPSLAENLTPHFVRGYIDGDGCVGYYPNYGSFSFSATGTKDMLEYIRIVSGMSDGIHVRSIGNVSTVSFAGATAVRRFYSYIYRDKTVFLQRKWDKALAMLKDIGGCTERSETAALADLLD